MSKFSRTIANILCGVLCFGAVAGAGAALYMGGKNNGWFDEYKKPSNEHHAPENGESETAEGMQIVPETTASQMRVKARTLAASEYSNYGVSTQAENAYTLTAEVLPDYASDKSLNWSVAWQDPSSAWANGKTVTDYVTITPTTDGALTAVCACLQDFGEPVTLTVSSRSNPEVCGTTAVHYYQRIKSLNYSFKYDGEDIDVSADSHGVYKFDYTGAEKDYTVDFVPVYSNYTLNDTYTTTVKGVFSSTFGYTASESLTTAKISAGLFGGEPQDDNVSSLRYALNQYVAMCDSGATGEGAGVAAGQFARTIKQSCSALSYKNSNHPFYLHVKDLAEKFDYDMCDFHGTYMPRCIGSANLTDIKSRLNSYNAPAYNYYGASVSNYNDFVSAVKKCNNAGVGVIQFTVKIKGTYSTYETVLNLGYNDEFKTNVQNVNVSDVIVSF